MKTARVFIADDHEITRMGVQSTLKQDPTFDFCGETSDGRTAIQQMLRLQPDLAVLDLGLPHLNGVEVARQARLRNPYLSVLIFTEIDSEQSMRSALEIGVAGYVLKSDPVCDLLTAARMAIQGKTFYTPRMKNIVLGAVKTRYSSHRLTAREREVLQLIVEGKGTKYIAKVLLLSCKTVETHRARIMKKLDVHSTPNLILHAIRNEIVHVPDLTPFFFSPEASGCAAPQPSLEWTGRVIAQGAANLSGF